MPLLFDDYITLLNLRMPLTYIVTLYHIQEATRDVVIGNMFIS